MSWEVKNEKLVNRFELKTFNEVIEKLALLAKICDEHGHHPDFRVFDYKHIEFNLCTHDAGNSVTEKDHKLSQEIDQLFNV